MKKTKIGTTLNCVLSFAMAVTLLTGMAAMPLNAGAVQSLNPDPSTPQYYQKYASIEEARKAGNEINERIAEEGIALFKNENDALPIAKDSKVSLFGS